MKLKIAGGCGEHGRNCFFVNEWDISFLVDCGMMAEEGLQGTPHLLPHEIAALQYVFLTHSHADHSAALPWLFSNGFKGTVIATLETLKQLPFSIAKTVALEEICPSGKGVLNDIEIKWGRSGHCRGSVWYSFTIGSKTIFFSGDYTENTMIHHVDLIREQKADIAVLDCAYGNDTTSYDWRCKKIISEIFHSIESGQPFIVFPVPKYGRGVEIITMLIRQGFSLPIYGDMHFIRENRMLSDRFWYSKNIPCAINQINDEVKKGIVFISDPQLRSSESRNEVQKLIERGADVILTGSVELNTYSSELLKSGIAKLMLYPVHLNFTQYKTLRKNNCFLHAVAYHTPEFKAQNEIVI